MPSILCFLNMIQRFCFIWWQGPIMSRQKNGYLIILMIYVKWRSSYRAGIWKWWGLNPGLFLRKYSADWWRSDWITSWTRRKKRLNLSGKSLKTIWNENVFLKKSILLERGRCTEMRPQSWIWYLILNPDNPDNAVAFYYDLSRQGGVRNVFWQQSCSHANSYRSGNHTRRFVIKFTVLSWLQEQ